MRVAEKVKKTRYWCGLADNLRCNNAADTGEAWVICAKAFGKHAKSRQGPTPRRLFLRGLLNSLLPSARERPGKGRTVARVSGFGLGPCSAHHNAGGPPRVPPQATMGKRTVTTSPPSGRSSATTVPLSAMACCFTSHRPMPKWLWPLVLSAPGREE